MQRELKTSVVIPVKELSEAKSRLSIILTWKERQAFCLAMLRDVLIALNECKRVDRKVVISSDSLVLQIAHEFNIETIREASQGLNPAINQATKWCLDRGIKSMLVIPADIPLVTSEDIDTVISMANKAPSIVICPSRDRKGTNALLRFPPNIIPARYGPNSFKLHTSEAANKKIIVKLFYSPNLGLDIDCVKDLIDFIRKESKTNSYRFLAKVGINERLARRAGVSTRVLSRRT